MADPAQATTTSDDPLAKALQSLFVSFASVVQGELQLSNQCSNNEYDLLKNMNLRAATEYDNFGDFASGLSSFVGRLKQKNEHFNQYLQDMEVIDKQVTELEALVSTLDNYTSSLHAQIKALEPAEYFLGNWNNWQTCWPCRCWKVPDGGFIDSNVEVVDPQLLHCGDS